MPGTVDRFFGSAQRGVARATVGEPVTYRLFVSSRLNVPTGATAEVYRDVEIRDAIVQVVQAREIVVGGPLQVGDERVEFASAWLEGQAPFAKARGLSTSDRVVTAAGSRRVVAWDDAGPVTRVTVRR